MIYGGTNGLKFFDSVIRYDLEKKEWRLMTKYPPTQQDSSYFKDGRFALVSAVAPNGTWVLFGGCSDTQDCNDFLVIRKEHLVNGLNFSVIQQII